MTAQDFQKNRSGDLRKFFEDNLGKEFITILNGLRPSLGESFATEHAMLRAYAKIEGYELCLRTMISLAMPPKLVSQPEANYGVPDRKPVEGTTENK